LSENFKDVNIEEDLKAKDVTLTQKISQTKTSYVETDATRTLLQKMIQDHLLGRDICLLGPKGSGRSTIVRHFASLLGTSIETLTLYKGMQFFTLFVTTFKDMSTRDLLQRRVTHTDGSTDWEGSPLLVAALTGRVVVLDNVDRLPVGVLTILQRLIHDREVSIL
jgi:MoxR-like ATPase